MKNKYKKNAYIIILLLIVLALMTVLLLGISTEVALEIKLTSVEKQHIKLLGIAQCALSLAENHVMNKERYRSMTQLDIANIREYPLSSWREKGNLLSVNNQETRSYFLVEKQESAPCVIVKQEDGRTKNAQFYHLVSMTSSINCAMRILLESYIAIPAAENEVCENNQYRTIVSGRQSWRQLA